MDNTQVQAKAAGQKTEQDRRVELSRLLSQTAVVGSDGIGLPAKLIQQCEILGGMPLMLGDSRITTLRAVADWEAKMTKAGKAIYIIQDSGYSTQTVGVIGDYVLKAKVSVFLSPRT